MYRGCPSWRCPWDREFQLGQRHEHGWDKKIFKLFTRWHQHEQALPYYKNYGEWRDLEQILNYGHLNYLLITLVNYKVLMRLSFALAAPELENLITIPFFYVYPCTYVSHPLSRDWITRYNNPEWILSNAGAMYSVLFIFGNKWWIEIELGQGEVPIGLVGPISQPCGTIGTMSHTLIPTCAQCAFRINFALGSYGWPAPSYIEGQCHTGPDTWQLV